MVWLLMLDIIVRRMALYAAVVVFAVGVWVTLAIGLFRLARGGYRS